MLCFRNITTENHYYGRVNLYTERSRLFLFKKNGLNLKSKRNFPDEDSSFYV